MIRETEERVPQKMQAIYEAITELTDQFCHTQLDAECAQLCRKMAATLARKRPSPLETGRANTWAAGIIHAIAQTNFLFDKTQPVHSTAEAVANAFGIAKSTAGNKAKQIRDLLKIGLMDPKWTLPSKMGSNTMAWLISVNGLILDARYAPREIQEAAYAKGLIPYIPERPEDAA